MTRTRTITVTGVAGLLALATAPIGAAQAPTGFSDPRTIDNPYLPLTKFKRCELRGRLDDGTRERTVRTLLERTRRFQIDGQAVDAAVIEDRAFEDGTLVERTLDYFAQGDDGTVYYLGEHVDNIRRGRVVNHNGTWLYGRHTDVLGVAMPPNPQVGDQWRFEDVPGVTTESNRLEETGLRIRAGGRLYTGVIRISEFIQPEGEMEQKLYAPGTGVIIEYPPDGRAVLRGCR
jgi:hypothetical protein